MPRGSPSAREVVKINVPNRPEYILRQLGKREDLLFRLNSSIFDRMESELTIIPGGAGKESNSETLISLKKKCTAVERTFAERYTFNLDGYKTCKEMGYAFPEVQAQNFMHSENCRAYIDKIIELTLDSPADNIARIQAMAKNDLSRYMVPVQRIRHDMIEVSYYRLMEQLKKEQDMEDEFVMEATLTKKELEMYMEKARQRSQQIVRYRIEYKRDPRAKKIIQGPPYLATEMELDLEKIAQDHEAGKIKSFSRLKDGSYKVEMYSALEAAVQLAKIQGQYKSDNDQKRPLFNLEMENVVFK